MEIEISAIGQVWNIALLSLNKKTFSLLQTGKTIVNQWCLKQIIHCYFQLAKLNNCEKRILQICFLCQILTGLLTLVQKQWCIIFQLVAVLGSFLLRCTYLHNSCTKLSTFHTVLAFFPEETPFYPNMGRNREETGFKPVSSGKKG